MAKAFCEKCEIVVTTVDGIYSCGHRKPVLTREELWREVFESVDIDVKNYMSLGYSRIDALKLIASGRPMNDESVILEYPQMDLD